MTGLSHLKYMVLGALGALAVALVAGVPLQSALLLAVFLACPLMMMFMMGSGQNHMQHMHDARQRPDSSDDAQGRVDAHDHRP